MSGGVPGGEGGSEVGGSEVRGEISHASSAEEALASQSSPTAAVYEGQPAAPASGGTEERPGPRTIQACDVCQQGIEDGSDKRG